MAQDGQSSRTDESKRRKAPLARMAGELAGMSRWKKKWLAAFLLIAALGAAMWVPAWWTRGTQPAVAAPAGDAAQRSADAPAGARGFVDPARTGTGDAAPAEPTAAAPEDRPLPWTARLGGWLAKVGISFAGGLVLGVFFRAFLKTMAAITALVVAGFVGLSYFEIIGLDFGTMRANYDSFSEWLTAQGWRFKDLVTGVLPSFASGATGFVFGFLRR